MVDFSGIRSFFTGSASGAAAPPPAPAPSSPAPAPPAASSAPAGDTFTASASDPARALSRFSGDSARSYTDPATAAGQWLGEKVKPHISESTRKKAEDLGKAVEDFKKREDLPGHELAQKGWDAIDGASKSLDGFLKENIPGLKKALEPPVIELD